MDLAELRHQKLQTLCSDYPSKSAFAAALGMERDQLSQLLNRKRNIGNKLARRIEDTLGLTNGELSSPSVEQNAQQLVHNLAPEQNKELVQLLLTEHLSPEDAAALHHLARILIEYRRLTP